MWSSSILVNSILFLFLARTRSPLEKIVYLNQNFLSTGFNHINHRVVSTQHTQLQRD